MPTEPTAAQPKQLGALVGLGGRFGLSSLPPRAWDTVCRWLLSWPLPGAVACGVALGTHLAQDGLDSVWAGPSASGLGRPLTRLFEGAL